MIKQFLMIITIFLPLYSWGITPEEVEALSLKTKVGQIGMFGFFGKAPEDPSIQTISDEIKSGALGNIIVYGRNIEGPDQLQKLMDHFHSLKSPFIPLFAVDQEGGIVQRLKKANGFEDFPSAEVIAQDTPQAALEIYTRMGALLNKYRFNYNLGPVVDINPDSYVCSVIGGYKRSYGTTPDVVVTYGRQMIQGMHANGVLTALKHFPGHGSARGDTHVGFTDVTSVWNVREKAPFIQLCAEADSVMAAHIVNNSLDPDYPASLSRSTLEGFRAEANYNGVIISDCLMMGAIQTQFTFENAVVKALNAGNDILLFNPKGEGLQNKVSCIIEEAVAAEQISEKRINEAVLRVLKMKERLKTLGQERAGRA